jgi:hypothetical protein
MACKNLYVRPITIRRPFRRADAHTAAWSTQVPDRLAATGASSRPLIVRHREAVKRGIVVGRVEVKVTGEFGVEGQSERHIAYQAKVSAHAPEHAIRELMTRADPLRQFRARFALGLRLHLRRTEAVAL